MLTDVNSTTFTIELGAATAAAGVIGTAIVGAMKGFVGYLRERDKARDDIVAAKDAAHKEEMTRLVEDHVSVARDFQSSLKDIEEERKETSRALFQLQKETVLAITDLKTSVVPPDTRRRQAETNPKG